MFQVAFLSTFVATHFASPTRLSSAYGFPTRDTPDSPPLEQTMVKTIKGIYAVSSWPEFFEKVRFGNGQRWSKAKLSQVLRDCVKKSEAVGYHNRNRRLGALKDERVRKEKEWSRRHGRR